MKLCHWLRTVAVAGLLLAATVTPASAQTAAGPVKVLGVENFYADVAAQVGGNRVQVSTILSDPSVDPHLYESNVEDAKKVAGADVVIMNGLGYDPFIDKLMAASPRPNRVVIDVGKLTGHVEGDNPHSWYDTFVTMPALVPALAQALTQKDPAGQQQYAAQAQAFLESLQPLEELCSTVKRNYAGTPALATEPLWNYQAAACGLNVLDAEGPFQKATQEGGDPPASAVVRFRDQLNSGAARLLIFNSQAVTPMSQQMQDLALANNVAVVSVSETMPANTTYQQWMTGQLTAVLQALGG